MSDAKVAASKTQRPPKRGEDGRLQVTVKGRTANLCKPKAINENWRETMRQNIIQDSKKRRKSNKRSMFGFFTPQSSTLIGDPYLDSSKREQRWERGNGAMIKGVKAKGHGKFQKKNAAFSAGEPYYNPGQLRRQWQKKLDKKRLPEHGAFNGGRSKMAQSLDETFARTRFQSSFDADEEQEILAKKVKEQLSRRRANRPKFTGFVQPNIVTSLPPAGGSGVHGRFIPVYDKELHKLSKYIESPFDAPKMERTAERQSHEKVLENLHDSKRFSGRVKKKDHFTKSVEVYGLGENADGTTIIMPTYKDKEKKSPLRDKDGQLMAPWYPSEPGKKGTNNDKKLLFQKMPGHQPDGYEGALQKTKQTIELNNPLSASIHEFAWNPNGTHTFTGKGTASILDNVVKSKHRVLTQKR